MFRLMSVATLVMILVCFFVGAGIALADPVQAPANDNAKSGTVHAGTQAADEASDVYDFSDYIQEYATQRQPATDPVDSQSIEESEPRRFDAIDC